MVPPLAVTCTVQTALFPEASVAVQVEVCVPRLLNTTVVQLALGEGSQLSAAVTVGV